MINPAELRLNNKVYLKRFKSHNTDTGTDFELMEVTIKLETLKEYKYFEPIPLTELWRLKFGLKGSSDENVDKITNVRFYNNTLTAEFIIKKGVDGVYYNGRLYQYVHQYQNLYYALTGYEAQMV